MTFFKATRPSHRLSVKDTDTGSVAEIGAAWLNEDGSFSVKLNPCVVISYDGLKGKYLSLFPVLEEGEEKKVKETAAARAVREMKAKRAAGETG